MGWVECKPEPELRKSHESGSERYVPDDHGGWRCPPGESFAAQFGLGFQVRSDKDINWMLGYVSYRRVAKLIGLQRSSLFEEHLQKTNRDEIKAIQKS